MRSIKKASRVEVSPACRWAKLFFFPAALLLTWLGAVPAGHAGCVSSGNETNAASLNSVTGVNATVARLQDRYDCTRTLQANFDETISSPGGVTRSRKGTVYFKKVGRMRWDFGAPSEGSVVSDGKTVFDYEKDLNQVVELPLNKALKSNATAFLLGLGDIRSDFKISAPAKPPKDNLKHLILIPKNGGDTIDVGIDPKNYDIVNFRLINQVGGVTELKFTDIRTNLTLDDSLFSFTVPDGADIVRPQNS